jgi:enamine deaminase RidA (YjgF/YER057c/UK114 family)
MAYTAIDSDQAKPVSNYQLATRQESGRLVHVSGQVAWDAEGNTVGQGDIRAQAQLVFRNLRQVLQEAGGDLQDLMKITTYVTDINNYAAVIDVRNEFFPSGLPASTLIVVESLFHPDWLLEVEGMAAIG